MFKLLFLAFVFLAGLCTAVVFMTDQNTRSFMHLCMDRGKKEQVCYRMVKQSFKLPEIPIYVPMEIDRE